MTEENSTTTFGSDKCVTDQLSSDELSFLMDVCYLTNNDGNLSNVLMTNDHFDQLSVNVMSQFDLNNDGNQSNVLMTNNNFYQMSVNEMSSSNFAQSEVSNPNVSFDDNLFSEMSFLSEIGNTHSTETEVKNNIVSDLSSIPGLFKNDSSIGQVVSVNEPLNPYTLQDLFIQNVQLSSNQLCADQMSVYQMSLDELSFEDSNTPHRLNEMSPFELSPIQYSFTNSSEWSDDYLYTPGQLSEVETSEEQLSPFQLSPVETSPSQMSTTDESQLNVSKQRAESSPNDAKCRVCSCQGGRHFNYYGCQGVCTSCRSFFRRSVQSGQFKSFDCKNKSRTFDSKNNSRTFDSKNKSKNNSTLEMCPIDSKTRRSCKKCRFERCLAEGMMVKFVQTKEELQETSSRKQTNKQTNDSKEIVSRKQTNKQTNDLKEIVSRNRPTICRTLIMPKFTNEERSYAKHLEQIFYTAMFEKYYSFLDQEVDVLKHWIHFCNSGQIFTYEMVVKMEQLDSQVLAECALEMMEQEDLERNDKRALVQSNLNRYLGYSWAIFYDSSSAADFANSFMQYGFENPGQNGVDRVLTVLKENNFAEACLNSSYETIYSSPWAPHVDIEIQHLKLTDIFRNWASPSPDIGPDKTQMTLFDVILLTCADDTNLSPEKKRKIENVQLKYILMLQRYLQDKYPKQANVKLANGLMLLQLAKELYQMHSQRLPF